MTTYVNTTVIKSITATLKMTITKSNTCNYGKNHTFSINVKQL